MVEGLRDGGVLDGPQAHSLVEKLVLDDRARFGDPFCCRLQPDSFAWQVVIERERALEPPLGLALRDVEGCALARKPTQVTGLRRQ